MLLYHGSDVSIAHPDVTRNTGFADLGRGFYLTDNRTVAEARAASRARATGVTAGIVSAFEFDETGLSWLTWRQALEAERTSDEPFGLEFELNLQGLEDWIGYIKSCRSGRTAAGALGDPAVIRAWIATEDVEMACSGFCSAADIAPYIEQSALVTQYCFRDQSVLDRLLSPQ